jgi:hypothetical protein
LLAFSIVTETQQVVHILWSLSEREAVKEAERKAGEFCKKRLK